MSQDYLQAAKERALLALGNDGPEAAIASLLASLRAHEAFRAKGEFLALLALEVKETLLPKGAGAVRRWIDGLAWPDEIPARVIEQPSDSRVSHGSA